jgi:hypothetical protein
MRRAYPIRVTINRHGINTVVIDSHYEGKHFQTVNDAIILEFVRSLDGEELEADSLDIDGNEYFATEPHYFEGNPYRLVWFLPPTGVYLGIINCYRRPYGKGEI